MRRAWLISSKSTMSSVPKTAQPKWFRPNTNRMETPVLKLYNSLTRQKEDFVPMSGGKQVTWYSCGPTVYDASHMGHARNYVSIDINRRILQDYFGYNVKFVQNVTDIDDKIILRARQNYLFEQFVEQNGNAVTKDILTRVESALLEYIHLNLKNAPIATIGDFNQWLEQQDIPKLAVENPKLPMYITAIKKTILALETQTDDPKKFYPSVGDVLMPVLDKELGSTINDPEIFRKLPAYWEQQFDKDMASLNVLPPTLTTRVSEYIPEIIEFVSRIISNGFAYPTADGSVYFDTFKFDNSENHEYAKCQPWNKGKLDLINDAEGSLSNFTASSGKKNASDFALWKASKPGEPQWESPWGKGRPGWHIECSVMASDIHGSAMDIHSGGIDLAFPHHDNELAQSEACFDNEQWVNYFLHTGHLHIEGQKMSKSLKNFITINEALQKYSARQLRLAFATVQWNNQLDFKESLINEVKSVETSLNNFFSNVRALNSDYKTKLANTDALMSKKVGPKEKELLSSLENIQDKIHRFFCDNLSTPQVLKSLTELVTITNTYIANIGADLKIEPILAICKYICKILNVIGFPLRSDGLGWENSVAESVSASQEDIIMPYVKCLSSFRDRVRSLAIAKADPKEFLQLTDSVRNKDLLDLNVSLDDRNGQAALVKLLSQEEKQEIMKMNKEKLLREEEKQRKKLEQLKLKELKEKERAAKAQIKPQDMFRDTNLYSSWDEDGLPLKDKDGNDVTKSMMKKLKKQWEQQKKLHEEYRNL